MQKKSVKDFHKSAADGYTELAIAIVKQAAEDYKSAVRAMRCNPRDNRLQGALAECRRFFRSSWIEVLTGVDGQYILDRLDDELNAGEIESMMRDMSRTHGGIEPLPAGEALKGKGGGGQSGRKYAPQAWG